MKFPHLVFVVLAGLSPWILQVEGSVQQDTASDIAKADDFYYQGRYAEALELLYPLDVKLTANNGSIADQARVQMLIGLTQVALGNTDQARIRFLEFCTLSPDYVLDELKYPRKVVTVFKEAQQECAKCVQICARSEAMVAAGDVQGAADLKADTDTCECSTAARIRDDAALQHGRELVAQENYPEALKEFRAALAAVPASAARLEAVRTTQAKIDAIAEAAISEWQTLFLARDFEHAAAVYDRIRSFTETSAPVREEVLRVTTRYQSTFQNLTASWEAACKKNDRVAVNTIRDWGKSLDPNQTIEPTSLDRMKECVKAPAPNVPVTK